MKITNSVIQHGLKWLLGLFILLFSIGFSVFFPIAAPVLVGFLLTGGIVAYRRSRNATIKGIATAVITSGVILILIILWVVVFATPKEVIKTIH